DFHVTEVQTCALPIYEPVERHPHPRRDFQQCHPFCVIWVKINLRGSARLLRRSRSEASYAPRPWSGPSAVLTPQGFAVLLPFTFRIILNLIGWCQALPSRFPAAHAAGSVV